MPDTLRIWEFPPDADAALMEEIARELEADATAVLVSVRDDVLTLQLVGGRIAGAAGAVLWVEGRGACALVRRETWPALREGEAARELVVVRR